MVIHSMRGFFFAVGYQLPTISYEPNNIDIDRINSFIGKVTTFHYVTRCSKLFV